MRSLLQFAARESPSYMILSHLELAYWARLTEWFTSQQSRKERLGNEARATPLGLGHDNFTHNCRAGSHAHLDHNQSQKCLNRVGAELHPIRNCPAAHALQQVLQHLPFTLREIKLLDDLAQWNQTGWPSFEQHGYAGLTRISCLRIDEEGAAKIAPSA